MSPGRGLGVIVGRVVAVDEGEGVRVAVAVGAGVAEGLAKGLTQALRSEDTIKKQTRKAVERFIGVYCTLIETGEYNSFVAVDHVINATYLNNSIGSNKWKTPLMRHFS